MTSFLNIEFSKPITRKFLIKHFLFTLMWLLGFLIIILRVDILLVQRLPNQIAIFNNLIPLLYFLVLFTLVWRQKWYYNVAFFFYPVLMLFWFVPKTILHKGNIYLLGHYLSFVINRLIKFKSTFVHAFLAVISIILLILSESIFLRIPAVVFFCYFFIRFIRGYIRQSFQPSDLFGLKLNDTFQSFIAPSPNDDNSLIKVLDKHISDDETSLDEAKNKNLERLILAKYCLSYVSKNLNGFKSKRAYVLSWLIQHLILVVISVLFFTFCNYQLFIIDNASFFVESTPSVFDFLYYTVKTITFNGIEEIKPLSTIAKLIEMATFLMVGIFFLIIAISFFFTLKQEQIHSSIKLTVRALNAQTDMIELHVKEKYKTSIEDATTQIENIKESIGELKIIIDRLL